MTDLPENWASTQLGEVCKVVRGITFPASAKEGKLTSKNVCCLRTTNVQKEVDWDDVYFVSKEYVKRDEQFVKIGDVLMSMANSYELVGKVSVVRELPYLSSFGAFLSAVRPLPVIDAQYLFHVLRTAKVQSELRKGSSQTVNIANISVSRLSEIDIPLAPLNEQKRIAEKLDSLLARVDSCQTHLERVPQILKRFRQSVLAAATSGRLTEDWREKNRRSEKTISFDFMDANCFGDYEFPDTWKPQRLKDIADVIGGITKDSKKQNVEDEELPYLRVANVQRGYLDLTEMKTIRVPKQRLESWLLKTGDILFTEGGDFDKLGRGWIWSGEIERCIFQNHIFRARLKDSEFKPKYFSYYSNSRGYHYFLEYGKQTTNLASINKSILEALPVAVPPLEEQAEIVRRVEKLFAYAERLEARYTSASEHVERLTPSLLAKAFRGELVGQNPHEESAAMLLERIQILRETSQNESEKIKTPRKKKEQIKNEAAMLKKSEVQPNHLSSILKERGTLTAEALWSASQLEIDEFYDQLKDEEGKKLLREVITSDLNALRLLEAI